VYPNPSRDALNISFSDGHFFTDLDVYSISGTIIESVSVSSLKKVTLDLRNYPAGSYLGMLKGGNGAQFSFVKID